MTQATTTTPFAALRDQEYMNLTTYRKSGEAMVTPVWFAQDGATLYVMTAVNAGKIKRIRNNRQVQVGPSDMRGQPLGRTEAAQARILSGADAERANKLLDKKYGLKKKMFDIAGALRGGASSRAFIAVEPAGEPLA